MNKSDNGSRRYILVQIAEEINGSNDFKSIADITKERLRCAGKKIKAENPESTTDLGFRVFKLDSSNIKAWEPDPGDLEQYLLDHVEHIKEGRTEQDILYEVLLKRGIDLCAPIETREFVGKQVSAVDGGALIACLAEAIAPEEVEELALGIVGWRDELDNTDDTTALFRDSAFTDDVAKANCTENSPAARRQGRAEHLMKFQFEPDLDFQQDAITAVCDLFHGQETCHSEFAVAHGLDYEQPGLVENDLGVGNRLTLADEEILDNLKEVQLRNGLLPAPGLESRDFTVEMETGTGKTYVYLRTIFELNQRYGFIKVRHRGAVGCHQGRRQQVAGNDGRPLPRPLRRRAL